MKSQGQHKLGHFCNYTSSFRAVFVLLVEIKNVYGRKNRREKKNSKMQEFFRVQQSQEQDKL